MKGKCALLNADSAMGPAVQLGPGAMAWPTHQMSMGGQGVTLHRPQASLTWAVCGEVPGRRGDCLEDLPSYPQLWAQKIK